MKVADLLDLDFDPKGHPIIVWGENGKPSYAGLVVSILPTHRTDTLLLTLQPLVGAFSGGPTAVRLTDKESYVMILPKNSWEIDF